MQFHHEAFLQLIFCQLSKKNVVRYDMSVGDWVDLAPKNAKTRKEKKQSRKRKMSKTNYEVHPDQQQSRQPAQKKGKF